MACQLDICGNINTVLTLAAAGFGWWFVHRLNSARDRINSERTMRTTELSKVYAALVRAGINGSLVRKDHDGNVQWEHREVEDAVAKIYLYGTKELIALTQDYVNRLLKYLKRSAVRAVFRGASPLPHALKIACRPF